MQASHFSQVVNQLEEVIGAASLIGFVVDFATFIALSFAVDFNADLVVDFGFAVVDFAVDFCLAILAVCFVNFSDVQC